MSLVFSKAVIMVEETPLSESELAILQMLDVKPKEAKGRQKLLSTEEYYETELPLHKWYMCEFHTHLCICTSPECLHAHDSNHLRRIPVITDARKWSYFPHKCKLGLSCKKLNCTKSHTDDEVKYHPTVYKTKMCVHPLTALSICSVYGPHCPFAHSPNDLRSGTRPDSETSSSEASDSICAENQPLSPRYVRTSSPKTSAPPFSGSVEESSAAYLKLQLKAEIEQLKAVVSCSVCKRYEKEWMLGCGHLICSLCCNGRLEICSVCRQPVTKVRAVSLG